MKTDLIHYLSFNGNCAEAMQFYKDILGGELSVMRMRDSPMAEKCTPEQLDRVMHSQLRGDGFRFMASDIPAENYSKPSPMMQLSLNMYTEADAVAAFDGLSAGGTVFMPLQRTFWAKKFGMFADKYGFSWMVNVE
jgi:PhnB protein